MTIIPRVYIIDDDPAVCDSLALWLGMRGHRTQMFDSAEAFLAVAQAPLRGCAIVDLRLGGIDGLELQRQLQARAIALPLIFVTGHGDVATARNALKAGAFDFIEKPIDNDRLVELVGAALAEDARRAAQEAQAQNLSERLKRLTQRERQVLTQVVAGKHNREIAAELGISARTVEVYKARVMDKLHVRRVPDLVRLVLNAEGDAGAIAPDGAGTQPA
jgi:RNA polymerase sigma factor (sigma-70 family)